MDYKAVDRTTNEYKISHRNIDELLSLVGQIPDEEIERSKHIISEDVWDMTGVLRREYDSPCNNCPNNSENGGSGICHCILGIPAIY